MSELTQHGRKALERCIREHQNFIRLADDYDLDEMSVQALQTAIESMQMRLDAAPNPAPGPSEHDESWAEMMEHDYDTAVRGAVISKPVGVQAVAYMRRSVTYKAVDGRFDGERIISERQVYPDDVPLYTNPQPVTPAGGEVEPVAWRVTSDDSTITCYAEATAQAQAFELRRGGYPATITPLYTHPPVAAALVEVAEIERIASHIELSVEYINKAWPDAKQLDRAPILRNMRRWARNLRAALNQRGGGA